MNRIKFNADLIKFISLFESLTRAKVKDCIEDGKSLLFIVEENEIGKAIGKKGENVRRIENALKRKIKIVEFNSSMLDFIKNLVSPVQLVDISEEEGIVTIRASDLKSRGYLIGRDGQNLRKYEEIIRRYFDITEIKVS